MTKPAMMSKESMPVQTSDHARGAGEVYEAIQAILDRLEPLAEAKDTSHASPQAIPSLLQRCQDRVDEISETRAEPIRTMHQFACTGGTLLAKCVAAMPNTQVLSEADPLSKHHASESRFVPTDIVRLIRYSSRGASPELLVEAFMRGLSAAYDDTLSKGQRLVIRDHSHGHYCYNSYVERRTSIAGLLSERFPTLSIVLIRNPIDSYLALHRNEWVHFEPPTFDEYCSRYLSFIDDHTQLPLFKYESLVTEPQLTMRRVCQALELPYNDGFVDFFSLYVLSGDSGRSGGVIEPRKRLPVPETVEAQVREATRWPELAERLGYSHDQVYQNE